VSLLASVGVGSAGEGVMPLAMRRGGADLDLSNSSSGRISMAKVMKDEEGIETLEGIEKIFAPEGALARLDPMNKTGRMLDVPLISLEGIAVFLLDLSPPELSRCLTSNLRILFDVLGEQGPERGDM